MDRRGTVGRSWPLLGQVAQGSQGTEMLVPSELCWVRYGVARPVKAVSARPIPFGLGTLRPVKAVRVGRGLLWLSYSLHLMLVQSR